MSDQSDAGWVDFEATPQEFAVWRGSGAGRQRRGQARPARIVIEARFEYVIGVLSVFEHADAEDQVFWCVDPSGRAVRFYARCQDVFDWTVGEADEAEPIEPEDLKLLGDCLDELRRYPVALDEVGRLFAARKRQRRPMEAWLLANNDLPSGVLDLFRACGPSTGHYGES